MVKKDISANLYQQFLILCSKILLKCAPQYQLNSFVTMATYWVPDLPNITGISGQLRHSVFLNLQILAWCALSSKHVILWPHLTYFELENTNIYWNQVVGGCKRVNWHGNKTFYSGRCVSCSTISLHILMVCAANWLR